jgi:hypothetical protein
LALPNSKWQSPAEPVPKFAKIVFACLICLAVAGAVAWLIQQLSAGVRGQPACRAHVYKNRWPFPAQVF